MSFDTRICGLFVLLAALLGSESAGAEEVTVVGFNVEGVQPDGTWDSRLETVAQTVALLPRVHLWGFSEVPDAQWARRLRDAAGSDRLYILGRTGGDDKLCIVFDKRRLELLDPPSVQNPRELREIHQKTGGRAPLVATFRLKSTGTRFQFLVNHLHQTDDRRRHKQATLLNEWAREQTLPTIAVGDYNFDWDPRRHGAGRRMTGQHDVGFDSMTKQGAWLWVQPDRLVRTQCGPDPDAYTSVLDFVFLAGPARAWKAESEILDVNQPCPDDASHSDHRPVKAILEIP